jgi:membrane protease YdiL (CAAX protease family)
MTAALIGSGALAGARHQLAPPAGRRWLAGGAAAGVGAYAVTALAALLLDRFPQGRGWLHHVRRCTGSRPRWVRAILVIPAAIGEELFWREAVLVGGGRPGLRVGPEITAYAAVQAASGNPPAVAGGVLLGAVTSLLRLRSGTLGPALTAHLVFSELTLVWPGLPPASRL